MSDDERFEKEFRNLREADARRAPSFERMWRARARRSNVTYIAFPLLAAAAATVVWFVGARPAAAPSATPAAILAGPAPVAPAPLDPAPLDFLLDVPGHASFLTTIPTFDGRNLEARRP